MNTKKALIILSVLFVVLIFLIGGYYLNNKMNKAIYRDDGTSKVVDVNNIVGENKEGGEVPEKPDEKKAEDKDEFVPNGEIVIDIEEEPSDDSTADDSAEIRRAMLEELRQKSVESEAVLESDRLDVLQKMTDDLAASKEGAEPVEDTSTSDRLNALEVMRRELEAKSLED